MFKDFIGRNVELKIAFSTSGPDGVIPCCYFGVVKDVTENSVILSLTQSNDKFPAKMYNGDLIEVNNRYIVYIKEVI